MKRILVTGDRDWQDRDFIFRVLSDLPRRLATIGSEITIVHGAASGADEMSDWAAKELGFGFEPHPAQWWGEKGGRRFFNKGAGPNRNIEMLETSPELVLAFHNDLSTSKGTKHCVTAALMRNYPVWWYHFGDSAYAETHLETPEKCSFSEASKYLESVLKSMR